MLAAAPCALLPTRAGADDSAEALRSSAAQRDLERLYPTVGSTASFVVYARPGGAAESGYQADADALEGALRRLRARLGLPQAGKINLVVHDSPEALFALTGASDARVPIYRARTIHLVRGTAAAAEERAAEALVRAIESEWAKEGKQVGRLDDGAPFAVRLVVQNAALEVFVDGNLAGRVPIGKGEGRQGLGVRDGTLDIEDLRVRQGGGNAAWAFPLRRGGDLAPDAPGLWRGRDEGVFVTVPAGVQRARVGPSLGDLELEAKLRVSPGATAEIALRSDAPRAVRVTFGADGVQIEGAGGAGARRLAGPPPLALSEGLAAALVGDPTAIHAAARVLLDAKVLPDLSRALQTPQATGSEATWRRVALASFILHTIERRDADTYRSLHFQPLEDGQTTLGTLASLEQPWRAYLAEAPHSPAALDAQRHRLGFDMRQGRWMPVAIARASAGDATEGGCRLGAGPGVWTPEGSAMRWRLTEPDDANQPDRVFLRPNVVMGARFVVRTEVDLSAGNRVRVTLYNKAKERSSIEVGPGVVRLIDAKGGTLAESPFGAPAEGPVEVVAVFDAGGARAYVDGALVSHVDKGLAAGPGVFALFVYGEEVLVRSLAWREMD